MLQTGQFSLYRVSGRSGRSGCWRSCDGYGRHSFRLPLTAMITPPRLLLTMVGYFSTPITCRLRRLRSLPNVSPSSTGRPWARLWCLSRPTSPGLFLPGSRKPFHLSHVGLRTYQEGFRLQRVRAHHPWCSELRCRDGPCWASRGGERLTPVGSLSPFSALFSLTLVGSSPHGSPTSDVDALTRPGCIQGGHAGTRADWALFAAICGHPSMTTSLLSRWPLPRSAMALRRWDRRVLG